MAEIDKARDALVIAMAERMTYGNTTKLKIIELTAVFQKAQVDPHDRDKCTKPEELCCNCFRRDSHCHK